MTDTSLPPIAYDDLMAQLADPDSDLDRLMGYLIEQPIPGRMGPEMVPNPALVTDLPPTPEGGVAMGLANWFMRNRRHATYRRRLREGWTNPRIVSEGDSWFQYPTSLKEIIDHLMPDHLILSLDAAGDTLRDMIRQREILINIQREGARALLLSAGGNDLFDDGQLGDLMEEPFPGAEAEDLVGETFQAFLDGMKGDYLTLFRKVHAAFPQVHMLIHGYGPAFPRNGSWIEKPLTRRGVPKAIQHDIVRLILIRFNAMLSEMAQSPEFHGRLAHIDVTDIGGEPGQWHDEIHLDGPRYALVAQRFREELARRLNQPEPESGLADAPLPDAVQLQAMRLSALDQGTLLREVDLRVGLLEIDPDASTEAELLLLTPGQPETEIGLASMRRATRRLLRHWTDDLREVICGGAEPGNLLEKAIIEALGSGKAKLASAIAGWLVTGPLGVPAALATALAAWLAGEALEAGTDRFCATFRPATPPVVGAATESAAPRTMADYREMFRTPQGLPTFDADDRKDRLARIEEAVRKRVIEPPQVPVDEDGTRPFMRQVKSIIEMLGGEKAEFTPEEIGAGVEAIILTDGTRPAIYVQDGTIDTGDEKLAASGWQQAVKDALPDIHRQIAATGRILEGADRSADRVFGTAWMLEGGRVATAKHVLEHMAIKSGGQWFLNTTYLVDFAVEADRTPDPAKVFRVESVAFASPDTIAGSVDPKQLDLAILTLAPNGLAQMPDPIPLAASPGADTLLDPDDPRFFNVGHPARPFGSWLVSGEDGNPNTISTDLLFALIGDRFGVKRFSPGMMMRKPGTFAQAGGAGASVFHHDATTLGGSSGSGIMMTAPSGAVMAGLHYAGLFGTQNYAHWVPAISDSF